MTPMFALIVKLHRHPQTLPGWCLRFHAAGRSALLRAAIAVAASILFRSGALAQTALAQTALAQEEDKPRAARSPLAPLSQTMPSPDDNPPSADKIALGKLLFFDPRLSGDNTMSCATCHSPD